MFLIKSSRINERRCHVSDGNDPTCELLGKRRAWWMMDDKKHPEQNSSLSQTKERGQRHFEHTHAAFMKIYSLCTQTRFDSEEKPALRWEISCRAARFLQRFSRVEDSMVCLRSRFRTETEPMMNKKRVSVFLCQLQVIDHVAWRQTVFTLTLRKFES